MSDACNEVLIKKNKKRKPLGTVNLRLTMSPVSKEEMNEVGVGGGIYDELSVTECYVGN